jgi:hypothetical protein
MKITKFRITNFRSIVDTGWSKLSPDGVTVLVGQNESGKSSILEAISMTFSGNVPTPDDFRIDSPLPEIFLKIVLNPDELSWTDDINQGQQRAVNQYLTENGHELTLKFSFSKPENVEDELDDHITIIDNNNQLENLIKDAGKPDGTEIAMTALTTIANAVVAAQTTIPPAPLPAPQPAIAQLTAKKKLTLNDVSKQIYKLGPTVTLFQAQSGLLPNSIDIDPSFKLVGEGAVAAKNYLRVAGLDVKQLATSDLRTRSGTLKRANEKITKDFATFWSQTIGKTSKLLLECELETYGQNVAGKAGTQYLVFWISDGLNKLYPKQRSLGVRWFISFYLQLKASELTSTKRFFLLDEPGANLHSKAQADVLSLLNKLSKDISIIYSTHSPHMIEYDKLYRVHAVQRIGDQDDNPTEIIDAHRLGAASTDTLSPILTAMGVDISHQQVIMKSGNVLLEEMSGFYYLTAFWELTKEKKKAYFIAATGVGKVETLANMFRGWGLGFIVAIDDDQHGRQVYNSLKRKLFGDDEVDAKKNMIKLPDCKGIEDIFSIDNFTNFVLPEKAAKLTTPISEALKTSGISKPVLAYQFLLKVRKGDVELKKLDKETQQKISLVVSEIASRLP